MINSAQKNSISNTFSQKGCTPIYAKEGEPIYQKDMDLDDDGKITFDEFRKYCDDNNISESQRQQMLDNRAKWQLYKNAIQGDENKTEKKEQSKLVYARKGDSKYKEEMDYNSDDKVTYEEYLKYCEKHAKQDDSNKVSKAYAKETEEAEISVEGEA